MSEDRVQHVTGHDQTAAESLAAAPMQSAGPAHRRSYIHRHWRGELPLGVSFWLNGGLLGLSCGVLTGLRDAFDITLAPRVISSCDAGVVGFVLLSTVWHMAGTWRSAGRRITERRHQGKGFAWAILARASILFGFLLFLYGSFAYSLPNLLATLQIAFGNDPTPRHVLRLQNGGTEVALSGGFDFGTAADLKRLLDASPAVRTVDLASTGGRVAEAFHVAELIQQHGLATLTARLCASACTVAFVAGNPRYLAPTGKLGFHRFSFPGFTPGQANAANDVGRQFLVRAGVTQDFSDRVFSTPSDSIWIPDMPSLLAAHVVSREVDGVWFALTAGGRIAVRDADGIVDALKGLAPLRRANSATYAQFVQNLVLSAGQGRNTQQLIAEIDGTLWATANRYRRTADDHIQTQIAALSAEEGQQLAADHADLCLAMLKGTRLAGPQYGPFLPADLRARETSLSGAIIDSGSASASTPVATEQTALAGMAALWLRVRDAGFDVTDAGRTAPLTASERRSGCLAMVAYMRSLSLLPATEAGALMRYLAAVE
jgi:hypothetical protein